MSKHRQAAKRDANEREIIDALLEAGCEVVQESNIDLYVFYKGQCFPMEVKTKTGTLTDYQKYLHRTLAVFYDYEIPIVQTVDDALRVIGAIE